jgi:proteasome lid subunit RPN8/RPN11
MQAALRSDGYPAVRRLPRREGVSVLIVRDLYEAMRQHAIEARPEEACGLIVAHGKKARIIRARNIDERPRTQFTLDPDAWLSVGEQEAVLGIYHSHPNGSSKPSMADLSACEGSGLPWYIVGFGSDDDVTRIEPSGFLAPYERRPYVYRVHDCYTLARDWYQREMALGLPEFERADQWWKKGQNLFVENFEGCGFVRLLDADVQVGDAFLIQMNSPVPNHVAIYVGDGTILHHVWGRLSYREPWGGMWRKLATHHLRHVTQLTKENG